MEIWFCINHGRSAWPPFCLPLLSFSPFPFIGSARVSLLVPSSSFLVFSSLRIDPRFLARSLLVPCSSLLLRKARDRHLHRWQGDSFVLSRRFQLIFIVYLPDRRYREDNGPPLYIRCSGKPYHQGLFIIFLCFGPVRLALLIGICVWFVGDGLRESTLLNAADWYLLEATRLYIHLDKTGEVLFNRTGNGSAISRSTYRSRFNEKSRKQIHDFNLDLSRLLQEAKSIRCNLLAFRACTQCMAALWHSVNSLAVRA